MYVGSVNAGRFESAPCCNTTSCTPARAVWPLVSNMESAPGNVDLHRWSNLKFEGIVDPKDDSGGRLGAAKASIWAQMPSSTLANAVIWSCKDFARVCALAWEGAEETDRGDFAKLFQASERGMERSSWPKGSLWSTLLGEASTVLCGTINDLSTEFVRGIVRDGPGVGHQESERGICPANGCPCGEAGTGGAQESVCCMAKEPERGMFDEMFRPGLCGRCVTANASAGLSAREMESERGMANAGA